MPDARPETDDIFRRLDALGLSQGDLAAAIGLEVDKVSKTKTNVRQFKAAELLKAQRWLSELESRGARPMPDQMPTRSADAGETVDILQLDLSVAMGPGTLIEDFVESEMVSFDAAALRRITRTPSDRLRFITGIGTSHEPKFQSGDQFLINLNENSLARLDGYYWITFDGAHALKRLRPIGNGLVQIISENPDFGPMDVERGAVRIEGRAIWFARGL